MAKFKRDSKEVEKAAEEALAWIERQTEGLVLDCKDRLRMALFGSLLLSGRLAKRPVIGKKQRANEDDGPRHMKDAFRL